MKTESTHFHGNSPVTDFKPQVKTYSAPEIAESYVDDKGDVIHILVNGNELSENNYLKHWGKPKGIVVPVKNNYKGKGLDPRTNWIK